MSLQDLHSEVSLIANAVDRRMGFCCVARVIVCQEGAENHRGPGADCSRGDRNHTLEESDPWP